MESESGTSSFTIHWFSFFARKKFKNGHDFLSYFYFNEFLYPETD